MYASNPSNRQSWLPRRLACVLLAVCCLLLMDTAALAEENLAEPEVAVESAGDSLASAPKLPWYDRATDDFRAADVQPPRRQTANMNTDFTSLLLWLGWIVLAVALVYLVYLIARAFLNQEVSQSVIVEQGSAGADISRVEELPVALGTSPFDFLDEAQRLYKRGNYGEAIVYLFSHQLLQLDRRHWVRLVKGKTNRQYLREVRRSAAPSAERLATMFEATVLLFEEVFFGKRLPSRDRIDGVWNDIDEFEKLVAPTQEQAA